MNEKSINTDALLNAPTSSIKPIDPLLAIAIFILSYVGIRMMHPFHIGVSDTILLLCLLFIIFIYTHINYALSKRHYKQMMFVLACCIPNLLFDNDVLKLFNTFFIFLYTAWFLMDATHKQIGQDIRQYIFLNLLSAILLHPLIGFSSGISSLFNKFQHHIQLRQLSGILAGCLLSIPILLIIIPLLISADASFQSLILSVMNHLDDFLIELLYIVFTIPVFCYLYSLISSHIHREREDLLCLKSDQIDSFRNKIAGFPTTISLTMESILIGIYVVFIIMTAYEISQCLHLSLSDFSISIFARYGFFELCLIAFINLAILSFVHLFTKDQESRSFRFIQIALCMITILIIFTAMSKMGFYIYAYGLTPLRIYSSWFMIVLLGMFLLLIQHFILQKRFVMYALVKYFCVCFFLLNMMNMNTFIEAYNKHVFHILNTQQVIGEQYEKIN